MTQAAKNIYDLICSSVLEADDDLPSLVHPHRFDGPHRARLVFKRLSRDVAVTSFAIVLVFGFSPQAMAACKLSLSDSAWTAFVRKPFRVLDQYPKGGMDLAFGVRNYATFNHATLLAVSRIISRAIQPQKVAIGEGLAMAVIACLPRDGETAREVADLVRHSPDEDVRKGYMKIAGEDDPQPVPDGNAGADDRARNNLGLDDTLNDPTQPLK